MKKSNLIYLFVAVSLYFAGCAKDGDTGPQGPAGTNGKDGNANVHTQIFTVNNWYYDAPSYGVDIVDTQITQDIADYGVVMVYVSNGGGGWTALPFTDYPSATYSSTYVFVHYFQGVTVWKTDSDLTQPLFPGSFTFKVVTISESLRIANPHVNYLDYKSVQLAFGLKD